MTGDVQNGEGHDDVIPVSGHGAQAGSDRAFALVPLGTGHLCLLPECRLISAHPWFRGRCRRRYVFVHRSDQKAASALVDQYEVNRFCTAGRRDGACCAMAGTTTPKKIRLASLRFMVDPPQGWYAMRFP